MDSRDRSAVGSRQSDQDNERSGNGSRRATATRIRWFVLGSAVVLAAAATMTIWWLLARDPVGLPSDSSLAWLDIAEDLPLDPDRRYSDEQLGLYGLIDDVIAETPVYIRFRTVEDYIAFEDQKREQIYTLPSGHERDRLIFEVEIEDAIHSAYGSLSSDSEAGGRLALAFVDAMKECAAEAGYPDINPVGGSDEEEAYWEATFGLTSDALLDLRHECAQRAASYPTLDPDVRDEMLNSMRRHYLQAVHDYIRQYEVAEIPVE